MSAPFTAAPAAAADAHERAPAAHAPTRPLYWSLRRELWENRSAWLAPVAVGIFAVVALVVHVLTMPSHMPGVLGNDPANAGSASVSYRVAALMMMVTAFVVSAFYSLEALSAERRDRSILFWKSLPVSDLTTVLAKVVVPLVVVPLVTFVVIVAMQLTLLLLSVLALLVQGYGAGPLWRELQLLRLWPAMLYSMVALTLWHAPIYAFLLLMSGWARRAAVLWAVLPLLVLGVMEKLTMDTQNVRAAVQDRLLGWYRHAFTVQGPEHVPFEPATALTPWRFLSTPGLWIGLVLAVAFIAAAVRLRRYREPG
jgi:ABC-2 type transport system permease protein